MNTIEHVEIKVTADTRDLTKVLSGIKQEAQEINEIIEGVQSNPQSPEKPSADPFANFLFLQGKSSNIQDDLISKILNPNENISDIEQTFLKGIDNFSQTLGLKFDDLKDKLVDQLNEKNLSEEEIQAKLELFDIFKQQQIEPFLDEFIQEVDRAALAMTDVVRRAFVDMAVTGEFSAKRIGQALARIVIDLLFQQLVQKPLTSFFSSILGIVTGGRAAGGTVAAGVPTLINERGQELFIPHTPGRIVNAADSRRMLAGGNQVVVNQSLTFDAAIKNDMMATIFQASPIIVEQTRQAVLNSLQGRRV